jgi:1,4-dihydroxy-2-naphthoate octaprenyltransferase
MGTYYVQTEELTLNSFLISVPIGALSCSLLAINNIRDRAKDALVGKRTLAVRMGDDGSRFFFALLLLTAHVFALFVTPWALLTLAAAPLSLTLARKVNGNAEGADLIPLLAKTGQLQLIFALLLATSLWLA